MRTFLIGLLVGACMTALTPGAAAIPCDPDGVCLEDLFNESCLGYSNRDEIGGWEYYTCAGAGDKCIGLYEWREGPNGPWEHCYGAPPP